MLFYEGRSTDTCQSGKGKEHKSNTVIPAVKGNVTDTLSLVSFNDFHGAFASDEDALIHDRTVNKWGYTSVGAYVTAAYVQSFLQSECVADELKKLPVIGVNHYGDLRASIPAGKVTRLRAGNVLPFGGNVVAYRFTGERLKQLLDDGRRNKNGFLQTSYLKLHLNSKGNVETITDCRTNKIIRDDDKCIVVLDAFITSGGDGYDSKLFSGYEIGDFNNQKLETTTAFIDYLKSLKGFVSSEAAPIPIVQK